MRKLLFILFPILCFGQSNNPNEIELANAQIIYFSNTHDEDRARDFLYPYLYYVDESGVAQDHLMDGILFMDIFNYSKEKFQPWYSKKDLDYYLDNIFTKTKLIEVENGFGNKRGLIDKRRDFGISRKSIPVIGCEEYTMEFDIWTRNVPVPGNAADIMVGIEFFDSNMNELFSDLPGSSYTNDPNCPGVPSVDTWSKSPAYNFHQKMFTISNVSQTIVLNISMPQHARYINLHILNRQTDDIAFSDNNQDILIDNLVFHVQGQIQNIIFAGDSNFNSPPNNSSFEQANFDTDRERRPNSSFLFNDRKPLLDELLAAKNLGFTNNKTTKVILSIPGLSDSSYAAPTGGEILTKITNFLEDIKTRFSGWDAANPNSNIELSGIYFMDEGLSHSKWVDYAGPIITAIKTEVESRGWEFYGVPFARDWDDDCYAANSGYGPEALDTFDVVWQQPNAFFKKHDGDGGTIFVDRDVIEAIIPTVNTDTLGVEIESRILNTAEGEPYGRINDYFDYGNKFGYVNSTRMHYDDAGAYYFNSQSSNPIYRQDYDNLYTYIQEGRQGKIINRGFEHIVNNNQLYNWEGNYGVEEVVISNSRYDRGTLSVTTDAQPQIDSEVVPLEGDKEYIFRLQTREEPDLGNANTGLVAFNFYNKNGVVINPPTIDGLTYSSSLQAWYKYVYPTFGIYHEEDIEFKTPTGTVHAEFFLRRWGAANTIVRWRNLKLIDKTTNELMPELFYSYQSSVLKPESKIINGSSSLKLGNNQYAVSGKRIPVTTGIDYTVSVSAKELLPILSETKTNKALIGIKCFHKNGLQLSDVIPELAFSSGLGMNYFYINPLNQVWKTQSATFSFPSYVASVEFYIRNWHYDSTILIDDLRLETELVDISNTIGDNLLAKEYWGESFPLTASLDKPVFYNELIEVEANDQFKFSALLKKTGDINTESLLSIEYFDANHNIVKDGTATGLIWSEYYKYWFKYFDGINKPDCDNSDWFMNKWTWWENHTFSVPPDAKWMRVSIQNFSHNDLKVLNPILEAVITGPGPKGFKDNSGVSTIGANNFNEIENSIVYPNPANELVNLFLLDYKQEDNSILEVYNIQGKLLFSKEKLLQSNSVDMTNYAKGIYLFKVVNNDKVTVHKVIVN